MGCRRLDGAPDYRLLVPRAPQSTIQCQGAGNKHKTVGKIQRALMEQNVIEVLFLSSIRYSKIKYVFAKTEQIVDADIAEIPRSTSR